MDDLDRSAMRRVSRAVQEQVIAEGGLHCEIIDYSLLVQLLHLVYVEMQDKAAVAVLVNSAYTALAASRPVFTESAENENADRIDPLDPKAMEPWWEEQRQRWGDCLARTLQNHITLCLDGLLAHGVDQEEWDATLTSIVEALPT